MVGFSTLPLPWPPMGSVRVRPQSFFASPVRRHTVFEYRSCLALCQIERAGYPSVPVVGGPVKVTALVLIGNGIVRLVAADVDVGKGVCHGAAGRSHLRQSRFAALYS